jgi:peptide-methionine (S)-S-oxide reductase
MKVIYIGVGTFWLTEAVYQRVRGITEVIPGYMGGNVAYPTSEVVATGNTGHAEVVKITYDEAVVSTEDLLHIFYALHDPAIQQHSGSNVGSQYRPVIFYTDEMDAEAVDPKNGSSIGIIPRVVTQIQATLPEDATISTHVMSAREFYPAEEYHYGYFRTNPDAAYSVEIIAPKVQELQQKFPHHFSA